jgi:hypothetical protein
VVVVVVEVGLQADLEVLDPNARWTFYGVVLTPVALTHDALTPVYLKTFSLPENVFVGVGLQVSC